ncbi:MAG: phosphomannomutase [Candidatus Xenobiia bacterium LiM19]
MRETKLPCFKAYDIRGRVPDELNEELAYQLGTAYAAFVEPRKVAVGRDIRLSSPVLAKALVQGLTDSGVDVLDIGLCGTEMIYFAVPHFSLDGGVMITASHNPPDYNGIKLVRQESIPISGDTGLFAIEEHIINNTLPLKPGKHGTIEYADIMKEYLSHILSFIDPNALQQLKVVVNAGNGCAGPVLESLSHHLPVSLVAINTEPDGTFPSGVPNPLLPENRKETADAVRAHGADLGVAWDGDYDRCFFFDENGEFIEGYYMVGLLAKALLKNRPEQRILHDPRLIWNTIEIVKEMNGIPLQCKTGHAFMKERMRKENAIYGGEMSAHHYFRDNFYCDSGMIPFLLMLKILSEEKAPLSSLMSSMQARYPVSGEINRAISNPDAILEKISNRYRDGKKDFTDGLSVLYEKWRFNVRSSNTEPLVRLNVETRGDRELLHEKTAEILSLLN